MALKPAKTHYCRVQDGIGFLGFQISVSDVCIPPDKLAGAMQNVGELVSFIASPRSTSMEKYHAVVKMNARIRGFKNYFLIDNAPAIRAQLLALDSALDALAGEQFGTGSGIEVAWQSREMFSPVAEVSGRHSQTSAEMAVLTGAYPLERAADVVQAYFKNQFEQKPIPSDSAPVPVETRSVSNDADPDVLVIDGRLHVLTSGCFVTVNADDLVVRRRKNEIFRTPISELTMVYLEGKGIGFSADLTMRLCDKDVPVVFAPLIGVPAAIAQPVQSTRANIRQQQVLRRNDPDILMMGLRMLAAKVANQASVLKYFARYRKRKDDAIYATLTTTADEIRGIAETLDGFDPATAGVRSTAMGHEGRAAARYWGAFANLVPAELAFPGRHTRHATDCVNSAINYTYGILYGEIWRAVIRNGLDPYFGIMHGAERDQGSLVFDLIEEYRAPFGDRLVLGMLGRGFELVLDKEGRIRAACRHKLVQAFHKLWHRELRWRGKLRSPAEILELQVASIKNSFLGKDEYRPFRFRW
jgi:CRISPR-associated protein Cas1